METQQGIDGAGGVSLANPVSGSSDVGGPARSAVTLTDRYSKRQGQILISGVQALVRLMLIQAERDKAAGLKTGGFVSGYRGSPLGALDSTFASAKSYADDLGIVVKPAVNEELGATAVAGTQQIARSPGARVDGIFSLWYGKGPGLDRASDAIRHGNVQGASPHGGVVLAVGDDHVAKSSSVVCFTDEALVGLQIPIFYPADASEIIRYGLHAFAMSRLSGSWAALKMINEVADATRSVTAEECGVKIVLPEVTTPAMGLNIRWPESPLDQEVRQQLYRFPAIQAYIRANRLDLSSGKTTSSRIGIVASGKSWLDLREALHLLGIGHEEQLTNLGIALYKPAVIWPLEPDGLIEFAMGLDSVIVVEEKTPLVESQIKNILYGRKGAPRVWGKASDDGSILFRSTADLTPELIAVQLGRILASVTADPFLDGALARANQMLVEQQEYALAPASRTAYFCSGCPHNRSTAVPEGSVATAGIGCHGLAAYVRPRTEVFTQMGGEGIHWMGLSPFTDEAHRFVNLGDGTYFHSGLLAVRQALAAKLNVTYKILYNDAVAMTGGQSVDGELSVLRVVEQLRAEGVGTIVVCADDPTRYGPGDPVRAKADRVEHRDDLEALQIELRAVPGVTVIVYDQVCAAERRRLRKRDKLPDPARRVFINELVCEGCGDCSTKSNCLSVEPIQTEFGAKRKINQSSCNKDYSCLNGFCPSFVTVEGGKPRKAKGAGDPRLLGTVPKPPAAVQPDHQRVLVAGVGGTGVVTIGALLTMSGHMRGLKTGVLDQTGLAQKGGAVTSHIHIAKVAINALRIPVGQADLVLVCDQIVGNGRDVIAAIEPGRTGVVANADVSITGEFIRNRDAIPDSSLLTRRLTQRAGEGRILALPFTRLAERLLGDAIGSNLMMIGAAFQKGWLPMDLPAFMAAIDLNGAAVAQNKAAFEWGRRLVVDPQSVYLAANLVEPPQDSVDSLVERRAGFLAEYQNQQYAERYRAAIASVRTAESRISDATSLTESAVRSLFKLMAYKDEYEVARLYTDGSFAREIAAQFEGDVQLSFHMAPPIFSKRDKLTGHLRKRRFGSWMMRVFSILARLKILRGSAFDVFGFSAERREERSLVGEFESLLVQLSDTLSERSLPLAIEIASLPMDIRGYGHVKAAATQAYRSKLKTKLSELESLFNDPQVVVARSGSRI